MIRIVYLHGLPAVSRAREQDWLAELPAAFQDRLRRQQRRQRLLQSLAGLQLLKRAAARHGCTDFRLADLRTTAQGKPLCDTLPGFSISHSDELVACALSDQGTVGLDVERLRPIEPARFARVFSATEQAWIGDDSDRFFDLWTRKEAAVKLSGEHGIAQLRETRLDGDRAFLHGRELALRSVDLWPGYRAALAAEGGVEELEVESVVLG